MGISVKIETIKMKKLQASEGFVLTNGEAYSSVGGVVYLPDNIDDTKWYEISEERYNQIVAEQEAEYADSL